MVDGEREEIGVGRFSSGRGRKLFLEDWRGSPLYQMDGARIQGWK